MRSKIYKEASLYREIIRSAWDIAWKRRELWILGLGSALLLMNGGAFEFIARAFAKISSGAPYEGAVSFSHGLIVAITESTTSVKASLFLALLLGIAIFTTIVIVATASGGALLKATARTAIKKPMAGREAFRLALNKIGPLLVTQLIGRLTIFTTFVLAGLGVYVTLGNGWGEIVAIFLFVLFAITALVISFLMMMTDAGVMIDNERWIQAAKNACVFLKRHWLISFEMIGLIFLLAIGTSLAVIAGALVLLVPFTLVLVIISSLNVFSGILTIAVIYQIVIIIAILIIGAVLSVFERAAWSQLYVRLADHGAIAKLERLWRLAHSKIHARLFKR